MNQLYQFQRLVKILFTSRIVQLANDYMKYNECLKCLSSKRNRDQLIRFYFIQNMCKDVWIVFLRIILLNVENILAGHCYQNQ